MPKESANKKIVIHGCQAFDPTARLQVCLSSDGVTELPNRIEKEIRNSFYLLMV